MFVSSIVRTNCALQRGTHCTRSHCLIVICDEVASIKASLLHRHCKQTVSVRGLKILLAEPDAHQLLNARRSITLHSSKVKGTPIELLLLHMDSTLGTREYTGKEDSDFVAAFDLLIESGAECPPYRVLRHEWLCRHAYQRKYLPRPQTEPTDVEIYGTANNAFMLKRYVKQHRDDFDSDSLKAALKIAQRNNWQDTLKHLFKLASAVELVLCLESCWVDTRLETLGYLLDHGADPTNPELVEEMKGTIMHHAAYCAQQGVISLLCRSRFASDLLRIKNEFGLTPPECAEQHGYRLKFK
jgi:hypothetical protein